MCDKETEIKKKNGFTIKFARPQHQYNGAKRKLKKCTKFARILKKMVHKIFTVFHHLQYLLYVIIISGSKKKFMC